MKPPAVAVPLVQVFPLVAIENWVELSVVVDGVKAVTESPPTYIKLNTSESLPSNPCTHCISFAASPVSSIVSANLYLI